MRYEYYCDADGEWRWRLRARNGHITADSGEGYSSESNVRRAIRRHIWLNRFSFARIVEVAE